jgi:gas vesicle protein
MSQESNYTKGFIIGALVGGAAGAVTALLLAPKSGAELRKDIANTSTEIYGKASDYVTQIESQVGTSVVNSVNEGKEKASKIMSAARNKAEEILQDAEKVLNEARSKASNAKENVQHKIENVRDAAKAGAEAFKTEMNTSTES